MCKCLGNLIKWSLRYISSVLDLKNSANSLITAYLT